VEPEEAHANANANANANSIANANANANANSSSNDFQPTLPHCRSVGVLLWVSGQHRSP